MYCDCPPSRCGGTTIRRAITFAAAAPSSRRTRCSAASIPAAVPALVITLRSSTKSTSGSTLASGYRAANSSVYIQCVVQRRPSRMPAWPRANAPLQTLRIQAPRRSASRSTSR